MSKKRSASERVGEFCMVLGAVMIAAALALLLYNRSENTEAGEAAESVLQAVRAEIDLAGMTEPTEAVDTAEPTEADEAAEATEEPVITVDGAEYIGTIYIPVLELELPVQSTWNSSKLRVSPCRYYGTAAQGNLVLCAHNYDRHFGRLKTLQAGDLVTFTDAAGESRYYEVALVETLQPTQISEMLSGEYPLTLFTCTYGGQSRVTVRCNLIG